MANLQDNSGERFERKTGEKIKKVQADQQMDRRKKPGRGEGEKERTDCRRRKKMAKEPPANKVCSFKRACEGAKGKY